MAFGFFKKSDKTEKKETLTGPHYFNLVVKQVVQETKDAISIVFEQPEKKIVYKAGQFLTLIVTMAGKEVRRAYSINTSPVTDADLSVTVKRVEGGLMSNWLPDNIKAGSSIKVMEAMGHFTTEFKKDNKRHLVMFAGGSGITPMMSIIKTTLVEEPDSICSLIYANRDIDSIIFKNTFDQLQTQYEGRLHVIHVLDNAPVNWQGHSGLLNHEMLTKILERIPDWGISNTTYLMCGPEGMMKNVQTLLEARQIPTDKIFKESFVQGTIDKEAKKESEPAPKSNTGAHEVTVRYDGQEYKFMVEPNRTILETALDNGIDLPYSCQSGLCTACRGKALSGQVKLDEEEGLSQSERAEGYVLTCVGHPLSDDVVIEIG
ncbi:MAG: nitric oxide dioxygenase [Bacteroidetes bacterium OLB12]|nr:MAG: nitric oxide dioxygenase [Bacteroidetes bacterium OLB12]HNU41931.1 ferredoxin--NADP reductase [Cyclobacteriaceae bacterium]